MPCHGVILLDTNSLDLGAEHRPRRRAELVRSVRADAIDSVQRGALSEPEHVWCPECGMDDPLFSAIDHP